MRFLFLLFMLVLLAAVNGFALAQNQEEQKGDSAEKTAPAEILSSPAELDQAAASLIKLTNEFRDMEKMPSVTIEPKLVATAEYFANFMAKEYKYGHKADGNKPAERAKQHGYDYCLICENIAYQYSSVGFTPPELAERFVKGWKESPEHRNNMLDPDVVEMGIAVSQNKKTGYFFAVQVFGRPKSMRIEFTMINRTSTTIHYESGDRKLALPPGYSRVHSICRPYEIKLFTVDEQEPKKKQLIAKFKPATESTYLITAKSGMFSVQVEKPKP